MSDDPTEEAIETWLEDVTKDPATGLPPDVKYALDFPLGARGFLIGHMPGGDGPSGGVRSRSVELRLSFPRSTPDREVERVASMVLTALGGDPTLGGRLHPGRLVYRDHEVRFEEDADGQSSPVLAVAARLSTLE